MIQQINLYQQLPSKPKNQLTSSVVAWSYGIFFLLLMINFSYSLWGLHKQKNHLKYLTNEFNQQQQKLNKLMQEYPIFNNKDLESSLQQLKQQLNQRMQLAAILSQEIGFSGYLTGLSRSILPTVWLNQISISNRDQTIKLRGFSLQALDIQQFLDKLNTEAALQYKSISLQTVTQISNDKGFSYLNFEATNKIAVQP